MSSDLFSQPQSHPVVSRTQLRRDPMDSSSGRWWKRLLLAIVVVTAIGAIAALVPGAFLPGETGPKLTHTIARRDVVVTVTERGFLESSENTEVKCKVRGANIPILWLIENGTEVQPGDVLARLGTAQFEDRVKLVTKGSHSARSAAERSRADVAAAKLAIAEYEEGRYRAALMTGEKNLAIAESDLRTAQNVLKYTKMMADRGYESRLKVEEKAFAVKRAQLQVEKLSTDMDTLTDYTRKIRLETLNGNLKTNEAKNQADEERVKQVSEQFPLCVADLEYCVVKAEKSGLVVYPTTEPWKYSPEIEVGATVYMGQTMFLMPNLSKMQVKVSIPEAKVHRVKSGQAASVKLADRMISGTVDQVASVTAPTSRWTGSIVTYDTTIKLEDIKGLMPGMSADVEVTIDSHPNVLAVPVAAVVETAKGSFCWVKTATGAQRRSLSLGDTNDVFIVVEAGLQEGEEVLLDALAFADKEGLQILTASDKAKAHKLKSASEDSQSKPEAATTEPSN